MHIAHGTNVHGFIPNSINANQSILLSRFFQEQYLLSEFWRLYDGVESELWRGILDKNVIRSFNISNLSVYYLMVPGMLLCRTW